MLSLTEPKNKCASWSTQPTLRRRSAGSTWRMSVPSISTAPLPGSYRPITVRLLLGLPGHHRPAGQDGRRDHGADGQLPLRGAIASHDDFFFGCPFDRLEREIDRDRRPQ